LRWYISSAPNKKTQVKIIVLKSDEKYNWFWLLKYGIAFTSNFLQYFFDFRNVRTVRNANWNFYP
jgi:hypothetical protein